MAGKYDLMVLSHLREHARKSASAISAETSIPVSAVISRMRVLEKEIISKYTAIIDFTKIGYNISINLAIKAGGAEKEKEMLKRHLMSHPNVNSLFLAGDGYNLYAETVFRNIKGYYDFLDSLAGYHIENMEEHHIIEGLKKEEFLSGRYGYIDKIVYPRHMQFY